MAAACAGSWLKSMTTYHAPPGAGMSQTFSLAPSRKGKCAWPCLKRLLPSSMGVGLMDLLMVSSSFLANSLFRISFVLFEEFARRSISQKKQFSLIFLSFWFLFMVVSFFFHFFWSLQKIHVPGLISRVGSKLWPGFTWPAARTSFVTAPTTRDLRPSGWSRPPAFLWRRARRTRGDSPMKLDVETSTNS